MFTAIQLYYLSLTDPEKSNFRKKVCSDVGMSESGFRRMLRFEPNRLTKNYLAKETDIAAEHLYAVVDPLEKFKNPKP